MDTLLSTTIDTPAGPFTALVTPTGTVRAAGFTTGPEPLLALVHPDLRSPVRAGPAVGPVGEALAAYLDGDLGALDAVPVEQRTSGAFRQRAWQMLREVKPGRPVTYTGFAELAGRPRAVRAAAAACAYNAVALFVPCHRVLRTDGGLGGYRWGLNVKKWLLGHERHLTPSDPENHSGKHGSRFRYDTDRARPSDARIVAHDEGRFPH